MSISSKELRSEITPAGQLRLSLAEREVAPPGPDDVVVRVEAAPINPADLAELLGSADVSTLRREATTDRPVTTAELPSRLVPLAAGRVGKSLAVGLEGAGVVIDAGANARHLLDKVVSAGAGRMYTQYRRLPASEVARRVRRPGHELLAQLAFGGLSVADGDSHDDCVHAVLYLVKPPRPESLLTWSRR